MSKPTDLKLFSVKDLVVGSHVYLFTSLIEGTATRHIRDVVLGPGSEQHSFRKYHNDFELWEVGTFDQSTGFPASIEARRIGSISQIVPELRPSPRSV